MTILGINASHLSTACILKDGQLLACVSEERLNRIKNQGGLPILAIKETLKISKLRESDIDLMVFSFIDPLINCGFAVLPKGETKKDLGGNGAFGIITPLLWWLKEEALVNLPESRHIYKASVNILYQLFLNNKYRNLLLDRVEKEVGISRKKVFFAEHHTTHAYSAYYSHPDYLKKQLLVLTLDAMGDGLCSTVCIGSNGQLKRIVSTDAGNSIGDLYAFVTAYLGMKMGEHEYKVMGLASYANPGHVDKVYLKLKDLIWVDKDLKFKTKIYSQISYKILLKLLAYERFDNIAGAIQKLTEELLTTWVKLAIEKTGVKDVACGGGVFMNVKANQKIMEMEGLDSLFVMPSCGDESTAIGAAYWGHLQLKNTSNQDINIQPLAGLYLGSEFYNQDAEKALKRISKAQIRIKKVKNIEGKIARLLSQGKVVARFAGRMEWGARALGNRSILSHPSNLNAIREINDQIKSRDFWMPFAPSIIDDKKGEYLKNPKSIDSPYMMITFDSTDDGQNKLGAAMHQYDFTLRPQVVKKEWNPRYWKLIKEFENITGIGAVLNTSFNLHGFPIVCSPEDALEVFERSGLKYLALENYLISKK